MYPIDHNGLGVDRQDCGYSFIKDGVLTQYLAYCISI